jgi:hypothetical protein
MRRELSSRVRFIAMLYVPKSFDSFDFEVEVAVTSRGAKPVTWPATLRPIKLD